MSKHQMDQHCHDDEPTGKKPRVCLPRTHIPPRSPSLRQSRQRARKNPQVPAAPLNLCDLPPEILEKIIGHINIWHHNRIRGTSKRLRDIDDLFVKHEFQKALSKHIGNDSGSYESAALRSIRQATEVYVRSGFESVFCGCILPMLRSSYKDPFCPQVHQIRKFLMHFYDMVEDVMADPTSQQSRLLYSMTLMRFSKAFDKCAIISSRTLPLHWRAVIELQGPWLGMLWTSKSRTSAEPCKRSNLLVILSEILIANIHGRAFKRVWECPSELYVFGNDTSNGKRVPRTLFTFTVHGSKKICSLFQSCLEDDRQQFVWPTKWPKDQFTVNLDITCKEAIKWGCSKSQHFEFSPFAKPTEDSEEEDVRCDNCGLNSILFD